MAWDRYAYVGWNSINRTDPTGHMECDDKNGIDQCNPQSIRRDPHKPFTELELKYMSRGAISNVIFKSFGIVMNADPGFTWTKDNLVTAYNSLIAMNRKFDGNLKKMTEGATFMLIGGGDQYYGWTISSTLIKFHVASSGVDIPTINFYHEMGHMLNIYVHDEFIGQLPQKPTWVDENGYVDESLLQGKFNEPIQSKYIENEDGKPNEWWADAFGNYMGDNINLAESAGKDMFTYVDDALSPYR